MKLYIDTNIILDVIYKREPFFYYSSKIWELTEKNNKIIDPESFVKKYFFQNTNEFY